MSSDVEEARRARPLSGGLWTLFSWLRRDERSSSESLSSAGSDRTAVSFAFLAPPPPRGRTTHPPPPASPTDSYKKRVRDRNQRRHHDRDLTLHRKYGLFRGDVGYDAFSLPFARKSLGAPGDRERRATSECFQRPAAHVPGKRRAPPPPASVAPPTSLTRRHTRKRPAPQPPVISYKPKQNNHQSLEPHIVVQMYSKSDYDKRPLASNDVSLGCRSEKYSKKDSSKNTKTGTEKSFLKQIFENRKRNSVIETPPNKILPSISELDKQAAEIIESYKLRAIERNNNVTGADGVSKGESWFCTLCLRKYSSTVGSCMYCLPEPKQTTNGLIKDSYKNIIVSSNNNCTQKENQSIINVASTSRVSGVNVDEKQKLKEMLKEMKDSLPKRPKHDKSEISNSKNKNIPVVKSTDGRATETPTLRIGSTLFNEDKIIPVAESSPKATSEKNQIKTTEKSKNEEISNMKVKPVTETVVITQHVVLVGASPKDNLRLNRQSSNSNNMDKTSEPINRIVNNVTSNVGPSEVIDSRNGANINKSSELVNICDKDKENLSTPPKTDSSKITESENGTNNKRTPDVFNIKDNHIGKLHQSIKSDSSEVTQKGNGVNNNKFIDSSNSHNEKGNLHTPLKISSLLNPVYIPKSNVPEGHMRRQLFFSPITTPTSQTEVKGIKTSPTNLGGISHISHSDSTKASMQLQSNEQENRLAGTQASASKETIPLIKSVVKDVPKLFSPVQQKTTKTLLAPVSNIPAPDKHMLSDSNMVRLSAEQHSRRRNLINQLEQSIAKGDERAAADAAVQLAQLRLACSVLSFSSQISRDAGKVTPIPIPEQNAVINNETKLKPPTTSKVSTGVQSIATVSSKDKNKKPLNKEDNTVSTETDIKENHSPLAALKSELLQNKLLSQAKEITSLKSSTASSSAAKPSGSRFSNENGTNLTSIEIWVEDREATRGPIQLRVPRQAAMGELRRRAHAALGLPARLQRWIVGRALCTDDSTPLAALAGPDLKAPFYLCVVESESEPELPAQVRPEDTRRRGPRSNDTHDGKLSDVYSELVLLERRALVPNTEPFECGVCMEECAVGRGAILRECMHTFCTDCLASLIRLCEEPAASCPAMGCRATLQEREIRAVVSPEEYERWLARGLATAESGTRNAFHCRTRDCTGWALCDPGVQRFPCPVCKGINCVPCQAIHKGETCEQHKAKLKEPANPDANHTDEGTRALLDTLITKGEALQCPECNAIITKKWGCDWVKCSACKTEICWATRGRRWGPAGRGDTSAGCRCGVDGKRCHPSCGYCH